MPTPLDLKLTSNYMIGGISLVAVALTAGTAVAVKKFKLKLPVACKKQSWKVSWCEQLSEPCTLLDPQGLTKEGAVFQVQYVNPLLGVPMC